MDDFKSAPDLKLSKDFGVSLRLQNDGTMPGSAEYGGGAAAQLEQQLPAGYIIQERYRVISKLGAGGMGSVYHVEHIFLRREFALKTLDPQAMTDIAWRRFQKEAHAANLLDHPSLIKVHDFGIMDGRQPFFVMDYFQGETLSGQLKDSGSMPLNEALDVSIEVCKALGYAHEQGVVHRDIKPSNVMFSKSADGRKIEIRIVDFGIAKLGKAEHEQLAMTKTGEIFGTPYYMSPEQCFGKPLDHRADIYSFGCMLFELLTGVPPCIGDNALTIMMKHQGEKPPSLKEASLGKSFPADLGNVVAKLIEKEPEHRYQNLLDVANDLTKIKAGEKPSIAAIPSKKPAHTQTSDKSQIPIWLKFFTVCLMVIVLAIAAFVTLNAAKLQQFFAPSAVATVPAPAAATNAVVTPVRAARPSSQHTWLGGYFSEDAGTNRRLFHFPMSLEESPGRINGLEQNIEMTSTGDDGKPLSSIGFASGNVLMEPFVPFRLTPTDYLCAHPEMLKRFRSDEIKALRMNNTGTVNDDTLKEVGALKQLKEIELDECVAITDKALTYIDQLPNLEVLILGRTGTTGDKIATLKRLRHLKMLDMRCLIHPIPVLEKLKGSKVLDYLGLRLSNVKNENMSLVASCTNLTKLNASNTGIGDEGFALLAPLHKLTELDISDCPLTGKSVPIFANFPELKTLKIDSARKLHWSREDCKVFSETLPAGCEVVDPSNRSHYKIKSKSEE